MRIYAQQLRQPLALMPALQAPGVMERSAARLELQNGCPDCQLPASQAFGAKARDCGTAQVQPRVRTCTTTAGLSSRHLQLSA